MSYLKPTNILQEQGYFQIIASSPQFESFNIVPFRVSLAGMYMIELQQVSVQGRAAQVNAINDQDPYMFHLTSPQFSSSFSDTSGIVFLVPHLLAGVALNDAPTSISQFSGNSIPMRNQFIVSLNNKLELGIDKYQGGNTGTTQNPGIPTYNPLTDPNLIFCFTFNYIRIV